jgi:hypothetical protein
MDTRLKEVRGIPGQAVPIFMTVVNTVMSIMQYYGENCPNDIKMENAIYAFQYLPNLCINKNGKAHISRSLINICTIIDQSNDPITIILNMRQEYIDSKKPFKYADRRKTTADDENDLPPPYVVKKLSQLIKMGQLGKAMKELERYHKVSGEPLARKQP